MRHVELHHDPPATGLQRDSRYAGEFAACGQCAEHAVERLTEGRRVGVADGGDLQVCAREHAVHVGPQLLCRYQRHRFGRATVRPGIGVPGERHPPPRPGGDGIRVAGLAPQGGQNLRAHAIDRVGIEPRLVERQPQQVETLILAITQHADRAVELIARHGETHLQRVFLDAPLEGFGVKLAGAIVKQRSHHVAGARFRLRVFVGAATEGKIPGNDR
jgi:hypothetical protein